MAAGLAESAVSAVLQKLSTPAIEEAKLLWGVRGQVEWLQKELQWMQCFLKDAHAKQTRGAKRGELAKKWLSEVVEVAYRAEDIVDLFTGKIESRRQQQARSGGLVMGWIKRCAALPCEMGARHEVGTQIEGLKAEIDQIKASRDRYAVDNVGETAAPAADADLQSRRPISRHHDDTVVVGLDAHVRRIVGKLVDASITRRCVISIVGTGGIGKTTLANEVYNSNEVRQRFAKSCACVTVSREFTVDELLNAIADQVRDATAAAAAPTATMIEGDDPTDKLRTILGERTYFIVLDDVWGTDVWERLRAALPDANNGSRVLITTRSTEVAKYADQIIPPYQLPFLNEKDSWDLFRAKALPADRPVEPELQQKLEKIGRQQLVKRCGGLPLALLALGGLTSTKGATTAAWNEVANSFDWDFAPGGKGCLKILGLSYDDLSGDSGHHLTSCFLYLGIFPEDSVIKAAELIQLWIAEGFIPGIDSQMMEDTAQGYLNELAQRSMVQVVDKDMLDGSVVSFRIHDLFRDLSLRKAREDGILNTYSAYIFRPDHTLSRLAFHNRTTMEDLNDPSLPSKLRSLLVFRREVTSEIFTGLKLRVIHFKDTSKCGFDRLPEEIMLSLIHLRYLRLGGCGDIRELPSSIKRLCNLQTLDVADTSISRLPDSLGMIQTLRHLYLPATCQCPPSIGNLKNLQTLTSASARGGWIERGFGKLINVRDLGVNVLEAGQGKLFLDSLRKLERLSSLELRKAESISAEFITGLSNHERLHRLCLDGTMPLLRLPGAGEFPPNLTQLTLHRSRLEQDPMTTLAELPNLMFLELNTESYLGKTMVCRARGFPELQTLSLYGLEGLEDWRVEAEAMPKLTSLFIQYCSRLRMLPEGLQNVTSLQSLEVYDVRAEFRSRLQPNVGDDWNKIQNISAVVVNGKLLEI